MKNAPPRKLNTVPVGRTPPRLDPSPPLGSPLKTAACRYTSFAGFTRTCAPGADSGKSGPPPGRAVPNSVFQPNVLFMNADEAVSLDMKSSPLMRPIRVVQRSLKKLCAYHNSKTRPTGPASMLDTVIRLPTNPGVMPGPCVTMPEPRNFAPCQPQSFSASISTCGWNRSFATEPCRIPPRKFDRSSTV